MTNNYDNTSEQYDRWATNDTLLYKHKQES